MLYFFKEYTPSDAVRAVLGVEIVVVHRGQLLLQEALLVVGKPLPPPPKHSIKHYKTENEQQK